MQTLIRLIQYPRPFWGRMATGIAAMTGTTIVALIPPLVIRALIDDVLPHPAHHGRLLGIVLLLVLVQVASAGLVAAQIWMMHLVSYGFSRLIRGDLYDHLQRLSLNFYESRQTGEMMSRLTADVEEVRLFVEHGADSLFSDTLKLVGIAVVLFWMNGALALVALLPVPVMAVLLARFTKQVRPLQRAHAGLPGPGERAAAGQPLRHPGDQGVQPGVAGEPPLGGAGRQSPRLAARRAAGVGQIQSRRSRC